MSREFLEEMEHAQKSPALPELQYWLQEGLQHMFSAMELAQTHRLQKDDEWFTKIETSVMAALEDFLRFLPSSIPEIVVRGVFPLKDLLLQKLKSSGCQDNIKVRVLTALVQRMYESSLMVCSENDPTIEHQKQSISIIHHAIQCAKSAEQLSQQNVRPEVTAELNELQELLTNRLCTCEAVQHLFNAERMFDRAVKDDYLDFEHGVL